MTLSCLGRVLSGTNLQQLDALQVFREGESEGQRTRVGSPSPAAPVWMLSPRLVTGVTGDKLACFPVPPFPHLE